MKTPIINFIAAAFICQFCNFCLSAKESSTSWVDKYNVTWNTPSKDQSGSMPLGNGDIGLNVWVEPSGDLLFYIGKTDAFDENATPLKLGRIRMKFSPNPFDTDKSFVQTLILSKSEIVIKEGKSLNIRAWVDANNPVIHIESESSHNFTQEVILESWRDTLRSKSFQLTHSDMFQNWKSPSKYQSVFYTDTHVKNIPNRIMWYHANPNLTNDPLIMNMKMQGLSDFKMDHPLQNRVFGCIVEGNDLICKGLKTLVSIKAQKKYHVSIYTLTAHPVTEDQWKTKISALADSCKKLFSETTRANHLLWWAKYWERSKFDITNVSQTNKPEVYDVARAYNLCRYMSACAGRGVFPIKHNGSIFSVGTPGNPDFRRWGGPGYWFQNNRLLYWPMLEQGDFDLMKPWFDMYHNILPLQKYRTKLVFNHDGAFFSETFTFWGSQVSIDYGWDIPFEKRKNKLGVNPYVSCYWQGGIEQTLMMFDYFEYTQDTTFARNILMPHAEEITKFYDQHYQLDNLGKIVFAPAQSLETWHVALNPTPEIAGLSYVLNKLLTLPACITTEVQLTRWNGLLKQLPAIPLGEKMGHKVILPAQFFDIKKNQENPELYSVFPYRIFGLGKENLELAINTYRTRDFKWDSCWSQNIIHAGLLGLTDSVKQMALNRVIPSNYKLTRFPAFFNSNNDWIPDIDHGGALQIALQIMLLQCDGKEIRLFPAWPKDWDIDFKLCAPYRTTVECSYKSGKIVSLKVTPEARLKDVLRK